MNAKNELIGIDQFGRKKTKRKSDARHGNSVANRSKERESQKRFAARTKKASA